MEISVKVDGSPPAKDSGLSIFNQGHSRHPLVIALLQKAQQALNNSQWNRDERRPVGLEVVVVEASDGFRGDAINYLGGVADVLQANRRNANLSHLGDLAQVSFYHDDVQIREVRYSVEQGDFQGYRARVWVL